MKRGRRKIFRNFFTTVFSLLCIAALICGIDAAHGSTQRRLHGDAPPLISYETLISFFG